MLVTVLRAPLNADSVGGTTGAAVGGSILCAGAPSAAAAGGTATREPDAAPQKLPFQELACPSSQPGWSQPTMLLFVTPLPVEWEATKTPWTAPETVLPSIVLLADSWTKMPRSESATALLLTVLVSEANSATPPPDL